MSDVPADLRYTKSHEWIRDNGDGTVTGPVDRLTLTFDEPMAMGSFRVDQHITAFTGPGGNLLAGITGASWTDSRTLVITFAAQSAAGTYAMTLSPHIWDAWSNAMDQDDDGLNGEAMDDAVRIQFALGGQVVDTPPVITGMGADPGTVIVP